MKQILETSRLVLREFELNDAIELFVLNNDPDVIKYSGDVAFASVDKAKEFLEQYDEYNKSGFGRWAVIRKDSNEFIGWCGLKMNEQQLVDIGFRFFKKEWNKGFATESAKACIEYGFNNLNLDLIIGRASKDNIASIKVLEKISMQYWKLDQCGSIMNAAYYKLSKLQYNNINIETF